jgi:hypothetical protein
VPTFQRDATVPQLYFASGTQPGGPWQATVAFLLPGSFGQTPLSIDSSDAWGNPNFNQGSFLFLPAKPGNTQTFAAAAWAFLPANGNAIAWIRDPNANSLSGPLLPLAGSRGSGASTQAGTQFSYGSSPGALTVTIGENCPLQGNQPGTVVTISPGPIPPTLYLTPQAGPPALQTPSMQLQIFGPLAGCLQFGIVAQSASNDLTQLDVGIRLFFPQGATVLQSQQYPFFVAPAQLPLQANLQPLSTDPSVTYFAFCSSDGGGSSTTAQPLTSYYRTNNGDAVTLTPLSAAAAPNAFARLVVSPKPSSSSAGSPAPLSLTPMGDFAMQSPAGAGVTFRCMGGLSGAEYFILQGANTNYLSFFAAQPGLVQGFSPGGPPQGIQLTSPPTTSYAFLSARDSSGNAAPVIYCAQPDQSVWYQPTTSALPGSFSYLEIPGAVLNTGISAAYSFPMLPYAGLSGSNLPALGQLEQQLLSTTRQSQILASGTAPTGSSGQNPVWAATKAGLVAQFSPALTTIQQIILSQGGGSQFVLTGIPANSAMWKALFANQLFLVITDPTKIAPYLSSADASIEMSGWSFNLDPAYWQSSGTIFILKFCDSALSALAADPSTWTQGSYFNPSPSQTSQQILNIIANAAKSPDPAFDAFNNLVLEAGWHGVLVLNGELGAIPSQLQGIYASIPQDQLYAHHVGIQASSVQLTTSGPQNLNPSIFGLIHYETQDLSDDGSNYQFEVQSLEVLFANSVLSTFASTLELKLGMLFGEPAATGADNIVKFTGVLQKQTLPDGTIQDTYQFQTLNGQTWVIAMQSQVLNAVAVTKAQLVTVSTNPDGSIETRFLFWGMIDFAALTGFDAFSFGHDTGSPAGIGLSFGNVSVTMVFTPGATAPPVFTFDASGLSIDLAGSQARGASFYQHFPLTLSGFVQAQQGATPQGLGYMGIQSPLTQTSLEFPWYGLFFDLNMGTVGALAGSVGFVASLCVAWSPSKGAYNVFVGLKLPGSSGGEKQISIEGVIAITFKTIQMFVQTNGTETAYTLALNGIALKVLSLSLPTSGQMNIVLFGDPEAKAGSSNATLGWYAAYAKPGTQGGKPGGSGNQALLQ